ncbi:hypothetical protein U1Q18_022479, partial [Sarracenia purpurea var. burkii]
MENSPFFPPNPFPFKQTYKLPRFNNFGSSSPLFSSVTCQILCNLSSKCPASGAMWRSLVSNGDQQPDQNSPALEGIAVIVGQHILLIGNGGGKKKVGFSFRTKAMRSGGFPVPNRYIGVKKRPWG